MKQLRFFTLMLCILVMAGCSQETIPETQYSAITQATEVAPTQGGYIPLALDWNGNLILPRQAFGTISGIGEDLIRVCDKENPDETVFITEVTSEFPEYMTAEAVNGAIRLTQLKSFEGKAVGFIITRNGHSFHFYAHDDTWDLDNQVIMAIEPEPDPMDPFQEEFMTGIYTQEEIQALVDAKLSLNEACEKISTVPDAIAYMYQRGYRFEPDNHGITAEIRYERNAGACVGNSGLFNALLAGDYEDQGYVYIFYAKTEHVFNYYLKDGKYYFCDFTKIFHESGRHPEINPIHLISEDITKIYDIWPTIEIHNLNSKNGAFRLATMYTVKYYGDPSMPSQRLVDSEDGKHAQIYLTTQELESQQILFLREEYTFEFIEE